MTEREKMLAGESYYLDDPELVELRKIACQKREKLNSTSQLDTTTRTAILKSLFGSTGDIVYIENSFYCDYGENIHVGEKFYANFNCVILDVAEVNIGKNCLLGPQVGIYTATHPLNAVQRINDIELAKPVTIGDNCWIGGHATINPGVTLGDNVVVASGSVVTKSFGDNVLIGGNPAKILKTIDNH